MKKIKSTLKLLATSSFKKYNIYLKCFMCSNSQPLERTNIYKTGLYIESVAVEFYICNCCSGTNYVEKAKERFVKSATSEKLKIRKVDYNEKINS